MTRALQLPPPANWQDFEQLCRDLYAAIWGDQGAQLHGRTGQPQHGVDVFGTRDGKRVGVQCKLRDQLTGAKLTAGDLREEVEKARRFGPALQEFVIATTAPRDADIQEVARELSEDADIRFTVRVDSWDDLRDRLDEHRELRDRFYGWDKLQDACKLELDNYLDELISRFSRLPSDAVGDAGAKLPALTDVYTALDIERQLVLDDGLRQPAAPREADEERPDVEPDQVEPYRALSEQLREAANREGKSGLHDGETRRVRAIEFLAEEQHAVLLGPAGSGKSAFLRWVCLCLAGEIRGRNDANLDRLTTAATFEGRDARDVWPHGTPIPLYVDLRRFVSDQEAFRRSGEEPCAAWVFDHLQHKAAFIQMSAALLPHLRRILADERGGRGVLLLLDGLDETPTDDALRGRLKKVIEHFAEQYPRARIVVTSRPYAYRETDAWRLDGFADENLAPMGREAQRHFVEAWYSVLAERGALTAHELGNRPQALLDRIARQTALRHLAERPLTLTLLTELHASRRLQSGGRAEVYEESVRLFFDRWNEVKFGRDTDHFEREFIAKPDQVMAALQRIALRVHDDQGSRSAREAAAIPGSVVYQEFHKLSQIVAKVPHVELIDYLDQRSGILLADGAETFRFPHRSFQEWLAAAALAEDENYPAPLIQRARCDPRTWRDVVAFSMLRDARPGQRVQQAWGVVLELVPEDARAGATDDAYRLAIQAAVVVAESDRMRIRDPNAVSALQNLLLPRLIGWLVAALKRGVLSAADRIEAGEALGRLGDPRIASDHFAKNLLPVKPGSATRLGRYPVTVQEFEEFIDAGGYGEDRWWAPDGGVSRPEREEGAPYAWSDQREHPNRAVVGVSWWESMAWCRWKSAEVGIELRLPTHDEWDAAATHPEGKWPWGGGDPSEERANYGMHVGHPSPVGCYPLGVGQAGHLDLGGNAWEWVDDRNKPGQGDMPGGFRKLLRGGSWRHVTDLLRSVGRCVSHPVSRNDNFGFRVCAPASRR